MAGELLRVTDGERRGTLLTVEADVLIGRLAPEDDGRLGGDPELSRRHAWIRRGPDGRLTIEDLGSVNGTLVNDERIDAPRTLDIGDRVRVGRTVLEVVDGSSPAPDRLRAAASPPARLAAGKVTQPRDVLVVSAGKAQGRRLTVAAELIVGREVTGEGMLGGDLELSRRHARIARDASGRLSVEDLGSANGTFVNDERIRTPRTLAPGDILRMAKTVLRVTAAAPDPTPPVASLPPDAQPAPASRPHAPAVPVPRPDELIPELAIGSVFAGCRIEAVINHGDMGVVYRAEELALQRRVAIKLIRAEYGRDERFRERFRRESRITAAINHPNVIPVFDAGEEDGVLYIMMRLVAGTDMRALIASEGRLEPLRAARIVRQVGAALDAAHARGMVHRDVKPANVLLARGDHVYLTDFGLAKDLALGGELTRHGTIVALAGYVAPEQILSRRVDARADIYALGCLLFEALTGEPPFAGGPAGQSVLSHLNAPRPSVVELRPELPREFDDVVQRAMATDPSERYPSAGDMGQGAVAAAGGPRPATPWSVIATGEAAPVADGQAAQGPAAAPRLPRRERAAPARATVLGWAIALGGLAIVAVGMLAALHGISTL